METGRVTPPHATTVPAPNLDDLLAQITRDNRQPEVATGLAVGNEFGSDSVEEGHCT